MGKGIVAAILCIHMLVWSACNATETTGKLGSYEILFSEAQPIKMPWRKLLQDDPVKPDLVTMETSNTDVAADSGDGDLKHSHVEDEGKGEIKEENVVLDANLEKPNDLLTEDAGKAEVKEENMVLDAQIEMPKDSQTEDGGKEEVKEENMVVDAKVEMPKDSQTEDGGKAEVKEENVALDDKTEMPKDSQTEDGGKAEVKEENVVLDDKTEMPKDSHTKDAGKMEVKEENVVTDAKIDMPVMDTSSSSVSEEVVERGSASVAIAAQDDGAQIQTVEESRPDPKEEASPKGADGDPSSTEQSITEKAEDLSSEATSQPQDKQVEENTTDSTGELPEEGRKEGVATVDDVPKVEEASVEETITRVENTETNEGSSDGNSTTVAETDRDGDRGGSSDDAKIKMVEGTESEGDEKQQLALDLVAASVEEEGSSNRTDGGETFGSSSTDVAADSVKMEEKHGAMETSDKEGRGDTEGSRRPERDEAAGEEKRESGDDNTEPVVQDMESSEENLGAASAEVQDKEGGDEETRAAAKEVESQLEALKRDTTLESTAADDQRRESDPSTDDEYDIIRGIVDLPNKFQETAEKVADHIRPDLRRLSDTSKEYFDIANRQISESFSPLVGRRYAPSVALMISYGVLLLPLMVVVLLFDHIKALFSLQKVLLFANVYLAAYFATLWLASWIIGLEPMSFFYHNSLSSYLSLQLLQASGYAVYLVLQAANAINSCASAAETRAGKMTSWLQWAVATGIGLHYYVTVFHPAVTSRPPHTSWKSYAAYTAAFSVLCCFARIRWVKKEYLSHGSAMACNKKS